MVRKLLFVLFFLLFFSGIVNAETPIFSGSSYGDYAYDESVTIELSDLDTHSEINLNFDLFIMDSWDGDSVYSGTGSGEIIGPDYFGIKVDGNTIGEWTFDNFGPNNPWAETNTDVADATGDFNGITTWEADGPDRFFDNYNDGFTVSHSAETLDLTFYGSGLQWHTDESWRVEDVNISSNADEMNTVPEPEINYYSIFIGNQFEDGATIMDNDGTAEVVAYRFNEMYGEEGKSYEITNDENAKETLRDTLAKINEEITEDDQLLIYMVGHGGSTNNVEPDISLLGVELSGFEDNGLGDEYLVLADSPGNDGPNTRLTDDELYQDLQTLITVADVEKWVLIDSCYSGGFWGNDNVDDEGAFTDYGDLNKLSNIGLITSATEAGKMQWYTDTGHSIFGIALDVALTKDSNGFFTAETNPVTDEVDGNLTFEELMAWMEDPNNTWIAGLDGIFTAEGEFGDISTFSADMWNPNFQKSSDFDGILYSNKPVPEPTTILLFGLGLLCLAGVNRKKH